MTVKDYSHLCFSGVEAPLPDRRRLRGLRVRHTIRPKMSPPGNVHTSHRYSPPSFFRAWCITFSWSKPFGEVTSHPALQLSITAFRVPDDGHRRQRFALHSREREGGAQRVGVGTRVITKLVGQFPFSSIGGYVLYIAVDGFEVVIKVPKNSLRHNKILERQETNDDGGEENKRKMLRTPYYIFDRTRFARTSHGQTRTGAKRSPQVKYCRGSFLGTSSSPRGRRTARSAPKIPRCLQVASGPSHLRSRAELARRSEHLTHTILDQYSNGTLSGTRCSGPPLNLTQRKEKKTSPALRAPFPGRLFTIKSYAKAHRRRSVDGEVQASARSSLPRARATFQHPVTQEAHGRGGFGRDYGGVREHLAAVCELQSHAGTPVNVVFTPRQRPLFRLSLPTILVNCRHRFHLGIEEQALLFCIVLIKRERERGGGEIVF